MRLFTSGHSNLTAESLVVRLQAQRIESLVDVRCRPGSRHHPHFARAALESMLARSGILYGHEPGLGSLREASADSVITPRENPVLRG